MLEKTYVASGRHLLVDISDAEPNALNDAVALEQHLVSAARAEGVTILGTLKHNFDPSGVTVLLLLAESHVSLHTYPDLGKAFFDAFTCGEEYEPVNIFQSFADSALSGTYRITRIKRGNERHFGAE